MIFFNQQCWPNPTVKNVHPSFYRKLEIRRGGLKQAHLSLTYTLHPHTIQCIYSCPLEYHKELLNHSFVLATSKGFGTHARLFNCVDMKL